MSALIIMDLTSKTKAYAVIDASATLVQCTVPLSSAVISWFMSSVEYLHLFVHSRSLKVFPG